MVDAGDEKVWNVVMFDLPVKTKVQQREANRFRNLLLDLGYERVQFSVYVRYLPVISAGTSALRKVKNQLPLGGLVRIINISDHQWSTAFRFVNEDVVEADETPQQLTIF